VGRRCGASIAGAASEMEMESVIGPGKYWLSNILHRKHTPGKGIGSGPVAVLEPHDASWARLVRFAYGRLEIAGKPPEMEMSSDNYVASTRK